MTPTPKLLTRYDLRYYLTATLIEAGGSAAVAELREWLHEDGFAVAGRASKTIPDVLRAEIAKGRVVRTARGHYSTAVIPRSTKSRILIRAHRLRDEVFDLRNTVWLDLPDA